MTSSSARAQGDEVDRKTVSSLFSDFLQILEVESRSLVDDTTTEKLVSLLTDLAKDDLMFNSVMVNPGTSLLQFLTSEKVKEDDEAHGFALRLSAIVCSVSQKNYRLLLRDNILTNLYNTAKCMILDNDLRRAKLHSCFLSATTVLLAVSYTHSWITESGLIDVCCQGLLSSSYYIKKASCNAIASFISELPEYSLKTLACQMIDLRNDISCKSGLIKVIDVLLLSHPERANTLLQHYNILSDIMTSIRRGDIQSRETVLHLYDIAEAITKSGSGDVLYPSIGTMADFLTELVKLVGVILCRDMPLSIEILPKLYAKEEYFSRLIPCKWNDSLVKCCFGMLFSLAQGSAEHGPLFDLDCLPSVDEISSMLNCFQTKIRDASSKRDNKILVEVFQSLLLSAKTMVTKTCSNDVPRSSVHLPPSIIQGMLRVMRLLTETQLQEDERLSFLNMKSKSKEKCLLGCFDVTSALLNSPLASVVDEVLICDLLDDIKRYFNMSLVDATKILQFCSSILPATVAKLPFNTNDSNEPQTKRPRGEKFSRSIETVLESVGFFIHKGLHNEDWGIRDSSLEVCQKIFILLDESDSDVFRDLFQTERWKQILLDLWNLLKDEVSYVKASVLQFITAAIGRESLWSQISDTWKISEEKLLKECIFLIKNEGEAFARRAAINLCNEFLRRKVFWISGERTSCSACNEHTRLCLPHRALIFDAVELALLDFDWEVRQSGLLCLKQLFLSIPLSPVLGDHRSKGVALSEEAQGGKNFHDTSPTDVLGQKNQSIISNKKTESIKDVLHFLSMHQVMDWLLNATDDYDETVSKTAMEVVQEIKRHILQELLFSEQHYTISTCLTASLDRAVQCPKLKNNLTAVLRIGTTEKQEESFGQPTLHDRLSSFLVDVISGTQKTEENLLDCY